MFEFDGITTDSKYRTISLELEVDTNMPVVYKDTVIPADAFIKKNLLGVVEGDSSESGELEFRHGIILHEKGKLGEDKGELSDDKNQVYIP